ncbi:protein JINGUBANG-like [Diospyros lotus]|uniref:protein JINGUBANG-like n=1 Tax=Diospyros lotus TaxID=55363 RepID=UPI00225B6848|nr:protein JINGUBANG-like [Diospyros lotus]
MELVPCPLSCQSSNEESNFQSDSTHHHSDSSSTSSLASLASLLSQQDHHPSTTTHHHHCMISTIKAHSSAVFSLSLAGKHLYSGSSDSQIRVWSLDPSSITTSPEKIAASGNSAVKSMVVSGGKLFSAHQDHKIRVWKIDNDSVPYQRYKLIATLPRFSDRVTTLFSGKNYVRIRRHKKSTWVHHVDAVSAMALSKDGSLLYSVSWDRTFKVWRSSDFKCLESVWNAHEDAINALAFSGDGFLYTGSADKTIKVWKKREGDKNSKHELAAVLEKHTSAVNALALSTDGSVLYSGACDRSIIVWERDHGGCGPHMTVAGTLRGHSKAVLCLATVSDDLVCSGSADKTVRVWKRGMGKSYSCLAVVEGHGNPVKCLAAAAKGSDGDRNGESASSSGTCFLVYSGSLDGYLMVTQVMVRSL